MELEISRLGRTYSKRRRWRCIRWTRKRTKSEVLLADCFIRMESFDLIMAGSSSKAISFPIQSNQEGISLSSGISFCSFILYPSFSVRTLCATFFSLVHDFKKYIHPNCDMALDINSVITIPLNIPFFVFIFIKRTSQFAKKEEQTKEVTVDKIVLESRNYVL